jgi:hypothetical protein
MYKYNLVLVHTPEKQDIADFLTIRNMMLGAAPDIRVIVVTVGEQLAAVLAPHVSTLPTVIFSPMPLKLPPSVRGTRLCTVLKTKMQEWQLLKDAGFPVPDAILLHDPRDFDHTGWGGLVVVKPNRGMRGRGVRLVPAASVRDLDLSAINEEGAYDSGEIVVQKWIDTGPYPSSHRVMTVLGAAVYCNKSLSEERATRRPDSVPRQGVPIATNNQKRKFSLAYDRDVIELAESIHSKLDFTSVMGIDIIRDHRTRALHVLELNSGGWTWHLSSAGGQRDQPIYGVDYYGQFDALKIITGKLIEKTRQYPS